MNNDTTILPFRQSESIADPLTELAREGARRMLAEALKAEADAFVASFADEQLEDGRQRIVRHGFGPERKIQTGIGALDVQRPKVRDRMASSDGAEKIRFTSNILPKWARRSISLDALLPVLYLKGISETLIVLRRNRLRRSKARSLRASGTYPIWSVDHRFSSDKRAVTREISARLRCLSSSSLALISLSSSMRRNRGSRSMP